MPRGPKSKTHSVIHGTTHSARLAEPGAPPAKAKAKPAAKAKKKRAGKKKKR